MFTVRFETAAYRPDLTVTIRTSTNWEQDIGGNFENDAWVFQLSEIDHAPTTVFKFVLEEQYWMVGDNLPLIPQAGAVHTFTEADVTFPPVTELLVESGVVAQRFFAPNLDEGHHYDVIVIGSGIGGGVLADQLSDYGLDVLVLEAGSYLFPTHIGNLPRQHRLVYAVDKNIWSLWDDFQITNYVNAPGAPAPYAGGQGFNLGGRSVFWGGLIPRMQWWEFDRPRADGAPTWPNEVKWAIESPGYEEAEQLLKKAQLESSFQDEVRTFLNTNLPQHTVLTAPMAVQHSDPQNRQVPGGVFSTADLLMESRISGGPTGNQNLTINLNHAVTRIETTGNRATGVVAYDLISNQQRTFHADTVVLAAGTVESAKIAQLSNLADPNGKIGVGITDHPIFFKHFALPPGTPLYDKSAGAKLLLRHRNAAIGQHRYNIVIELGTDFNQGRFIDPDILRQQQNIRDDVMLCEIVFLFDAPLIETNSVQQTGPSYTKPVVTMQEGDITVDEWNEIDGLTQQLISQLGGQPLAGDDLILDRAGLGGVAHEVGTLRLGPDGVVDNNLKLYAYDNLYACDLSVFPSSPAANPTLTLAALALRLATHLRDQRM